MVIRLLIFLLIQFGALAIGGLFTKEGVTSDWYESLQKAPWTPPGWFFGFAWTCIMICFSILLALLWPHIKNKQEAIVIIGLQWVLNILWNPTFFYFHHVLVGVVILVLLIGVLRWFYKQYGGLVGGKIWLLAPYVLWLFVATSLNVYILVMN